MRECAHVRVCACARVHAFMNACTHARMHACMRARAHITHARMNACMNACTHARMHARTRACTQACMHACTHLAQRRTTQRIQRQRQNEHCLGGNSYKGSTAGSVQWKLRTSMRQTPETKDFGKLSRCTHRGTSTGRSLHIGMSVASRIQGLTLTLPSCLAVTTASRLQIFPLALTTRCGAAFINLENLLVNLSPSVASSDFIGNPNRIGLKRADPFANRTIHEAKRSRTEPLRSKNRDTEAESQV